jgi:hypothetical protein
MAVLERAEQESGGGCEAGGEVDEAGGGSGILGGEVAAP